jgi:hypothetical protein
MNTKAETAALCLSSIGLDIGNDSFTSTGAGATGMAPFASTCRLTCDGVIPSIKNSDSRRVPAPMAAM